MRFHAVISGRTSFFGDVMRFADVYCSSVEDFSNYPLNHCFYPGRRFLPHEPVTSAAAAAAAAELAKPASHVS